MYEQQESEYQRTKRILGSTAICIIVIDLVSLAWLWFFAVQMGILLQFLLFVQSAIFFPYPKSKLKMLDHLELMAKMSFQMLIRTLVHKGKKIMNMNFFLEPS